MNSRTITFVNFVVDFQSNAIVPLVSSECVKNWEHHLDPKTGEGMQDEHARYVYFVIDRHMILISTQVRHCKSTRLSSSSKPNMAYHLWCIVVTAYRDPTDTDTKDSF
jgi:hypothetical protein